MSESVIQIIGKALIAEHEEKLSLMKDKLEVARLVIPEEKLTKLKEIIVEYEAKIEELRIDINK